MLDQQNGLRLPVLLGGNEVGDGLPAQENDVLAVVRSAEEPVDGGAQLVSVRVQIAREDVTVRRNGDGEPVTGPSIRGGQVVRQ
ncbi:hypothetical protein [Streptomyces microflavus]|uniref:hypothetical protein n=1 Tax=Streptomyces microflavus TaxID=1919 RepID=UPI0033A9B93F